MKQTILSVGLCALICSCNPGSQQSAQAPVYKVTEDSVETKLDTATMLVISAPDVFDNSDNLIFTLSYNTLARKKGFIEKISSSSYDSYSSHSYTINNIRNVIFSNVKSGESHLLCDSNLYIDVMTYVFPDSAKYFDSESSADQGRYSMLPQFILYQIQLRDWNNDKKIDSDDPTTLYISDANGRNFIPLIPADEDLWRWTLVDKQKQLMVYTRSDVNHDYKFNEQDKLNFRIINLETPAVAKEYFDKQFLNSIYRIEPKF